MKLLALCSSQLLTAGMSGSILGISHAAFFQLLDEFHVTDRLRRTSLFLRFKVLESGMVAKLREKERAEAKKHSQKQAPRSSKLRTRRA